MEKKRLLLNLFISQKPETSIFCVNSYKNELNTYSKEIYAHYIINDKFVNKNKFFVGAVEIDEYLFEKAFFIVSVKHERILIVEEKDLKDYLTKFLPFDNEGFDSDSEEFGVGDLLYRLEKIIQNFSDITKMFKVLEKDLMNKFITFSKLTQVI